MGCTLSILRFFHVRLAAEWMTCDLPVMVIKAGDVVCSVLKQRVYCEYSFLLKEE